MKGNKPKKTCGDCIHEYACKVWTCGRALSSENASKCPAFETIQESAAYYIGRLDGRKELEDA